MLGMLVRIALQLVPRARFELAHPYGRQIANQLPLPFEKFKASKLRLKGIYTFLGISTKSLECILNK